MTDKDRYQKIRENLGPFRGIVELLLGLKRVKL